MAPELFISRTTLSPETWEGVSPTQYKSPTPIPLRPRPNQAGSPCISRHLCGMWFSGRYTAVPSLKIPELEDTGLKNKFSPNSFIFPTLRIKAYSWVNDSCIQERSINLRSFQPLLVESLPSTRRRSQHIS